MAQEVLSQKIKRTCDGCGFTKEYELVGISEAEFADMQGWYTVIREVFLGDHFAKMMTQAHTLDCLIEAGKRLALPAQEADAGIDLASLRASDLKVN